jgi:hypothetical protein
LGFLGPLGFGGGFGFCIETGGDTVLEDKTSAGLNPIRPIIIKAETAFFMDSDFEYKSKQKPATQHPGSPGNANEHSYVISISLKIIHHPQFLIITADG